MVHIVIDPDGEIHVRESKKLYEWAVAKTYDGTPYGFPSRQGWQVQWFLEEIDAYMMLNSAKRAGFRAQIVLVLHPGERIVLSQAAGLMVQRKS